MYRRGNYYDEMAELVGALYIDYNIKTFPIDAEAVCRKMGIMLIPYQEYPSDECELLKKRSLSAFYVPPAKGSAPMIFYNADLDDVQSMVNIRRNIFHEVRHYVCEDTEEDQCADDLADYFGKYFLAPVSYLIAKNIENINAIIALFGVDYTMASFINKNVRNRKRKYGKRIFEYEKPLLRHLFGEDYDFYVNDSEEGDAY